MRVESILNEFEKECDIDVLVAYCSNHVLFMPKIYKIQDFIHKHMIEICERQITAERIEKLKLQHRQENELNLDCKDDAQGQQQPHEAQQQQQSHEAQQQQQQSQQRQQQIPNISSQPLQISQQTTITITHTKYK